MIHLEPVSERTFKKVIDMKLPDEQNRFVAPNIVSMAQAWLYYEEARPFAVCNGEEVVGFLMLDWDEGERVAGIWRFMIAAQHQHKGFGRAALVEAIRLVQNADKFDMIQLDYIPGNTVARELYASLGFLENGDVEDGEIVMTLPLTDRPKVGILTADADDLEDFSALLDNESQAGRKIPATFQNREALAQAVDEGRVQRLTLMGKTIGLAINDLYLLQSTYLPRQAEVESRLAERA